MQREISFTKMHGLGNDYIYIYCNDGRIPERISELSQEMSPRHSSVGADGIILILPSHKADFEMRIFNADGSEARMCGNGSRCVGKYVYDKGLTDKLHLTLDTLSGIKELYLTLGSDGKVECVTVDMGKYSIEKADIPVTADAEQVIEMPVRLGAGKVVNLTAVSMGNPHGVVFVDSLDQTDVQGLGSELERHPMWPDRANIEFAQVLSPTNIRIRVWERGSGETMACGTGACATAVAAMITGRAADSVTIHLLGGDLTIERCPDDHIMMTGPATTVYEGLYFRKI